MFMELIYLLITLVFVIGAPLLVYVVMLSGSNWNEDELDEEAQYFREEGEVR